jgi:hypothetical protein
MGFRQKRNHWCTIHAAFAASEIDRWWDEDRHHTRRPGLSACLAAINNTALSTHRLRPSPQLPLCAAADYIAWNLALGLRMLNSWLCSSPGGVVGWQ